MWKLGKRWRLFGHPDERYVEGAPVRPVGPSDAEVIARVARHVLRIEATTGFDDRAEALRDIRAILVRSDAGRAVLGRPLDALGEDPVDVLARERDAARAEAAQARFALGQPTNLSAEAIAELGTQRKLDAARERAAEATESRNAMSIELGEWMRAAAEARAERDEATRELREVNDGYMGLVDGILDGAPESWDDEDSGHSIALGYVRELEARLDALRVPREKHPEDGDGAPWPDARTDPNGFADAARVYQEMHSGCRCRAFGVQTPEHAPSVLCKPVPGDRRCTNPMCSREGEFGHEDQRVAPDDPWSSGDGTAPVAVPAAQWCGKQISSGPGEPDMICSRPVGHEPVPWCGFAEIAARAEVAAAAKSVDPGAWTVHHDADNVTRTFTDAQHYDTACEDRPHCTIVDHHAADDIGDELHDFRATGPAGLCWCGLAENDHPAAPVAGDNTQEGTTQQ